MNLEKNNEGNKMLACILIRGRVGISPDVKKTLDLLRLKQKHVCVVLPNNEVTFGMLKRVKDYVTFGDIEKDTFVKLLEKRGELIGKEKVSENKKIDVKKIVDEFFKGDLKPNELLSKYSIKPYFRLAPPKGGFERKGIKMPFQKGGVLGYREDKINDLIIKML